MQSVECVELLLFVLLPKMSVPDIKNLGLVRTHSGASFVINFASLSPASAWPSLAYTMCTKEA